MEFINSVYNIINNVFYWFNGYPEDDINNFVFSEKKKN